MVTGTVVVVVDATVVVVVVVDVEGTSGTAAIDNPLLCNVDRCRSRVDGP